MMDYIAECFLNKHGCNRLTISYMFVVIAYVISLVLIYGGLVGLLVILRSGLLQDFMACAPSFVVVCILNIAAGLWIRAAWKKIGSRSRKRAVGKRGGEQGIA